MSDPIQVVHDQTDAWKIVETIAFSEDQEEPFYVCDIDDIIRKYKTWKSLLPRVEPHYAVKCNDHPTVLKVLASLGVGFDCASKLEISKVLALGIDPSRIIYAHTTKPPSHIRHAAKLKVNLMTFDNELELHKVKEVFPSARLVLRIKYDAEMSHAPLGTKFGCDPDTEAPNLLKTASDLGLVVVGVSFHVGSGCGDPSAFYGAICAALRVFNSASSLGIKLDLLDIGGGYPGKLDDTLDDYAQHINQAIEKYFSDKSVRIISEPGSFFVDSAFSLACNVHSAKKVITEDSVSGKPIIKYMYYLNDGVFGSHSAVLSYSIFKVPKLLKNYPKSEKFLSTLWGPTCDSMDKILGDVLLPELQLGDWLVFLNMGAYTLTLWTYFNNFEAPKVYSIISHNNWRVLNKRLPFVEDDFIEINDYIPKTNLRIEKEQHYEFPESNFVRG